MATGPTARAHARLGAHAAGAVLLAIAFAACQSASKETLAAGYTALADAANSAEMPLLDSLASAEGAARAPMLRALAGVETTFADGLSNLPTSGDAKSAADEVVRLARERAAAFLAAAQATGAGQDAALAPIMGPGGDAFHAAVEKLRRALGLPSTDAGPGPVSPSPAAGRGAGPTIPHPIAVVSAAAGLAGPTGLGRG